MIMHVMKESRICHACGKDNSKEYWNSEHIDNFHYKTRSCGCGRKLRVKVGFLGDGYDNWDGNLEKRVKRIAF